MLGTLYAVGQTLMFIQSGHDAKLGVETCPARRTFFCEDHNASFEAYHFVRFEFHALIVEKGKRAAYVEKAHCGGQVKHTFGIITREAVKQEPWRRRPDP